LTLVPVVDHGGHFLGVVPPLALMHILRHEHVEDLHRLAGIKRETHQAREAMESAPLRRSAGSLAVVAARSGGQRLGNSGRCAIRGAITASDCHRLLYSGLGLHRRCHRHSDRGHRRTRAVALACEPPLAVGRGNADRLVDRADLGPRDAPIGLGLIFGDLYLALAVAVALFSAGCVATTIGLLLPWLLGELGTDPAYGSGPLATILQDVMSLLIYFAAVNLFLF